MRDASGRSVRGFVTKIRHYTDPTVLELMVIQEALGWIKDKYKSHFMIETNCLQVANWICNREVANSPTRELVLDCISLLTTVSFVKFARRIANRAAHSLSRASRSFSGLHV